MRALQDSLLSACMFNQNGRYYAFLADSEGDFASLSFVANLPRSFPRSGKFGDLSVRRVSFSVEDSPESGKQLVLRQSPLLMELDKDEEAHPLVLARNVNKFLLEFWDQRTGDWTSEWAATNQLPQMVRVTVALGHLDQFSSKAQEAVVGTVALPALPVQMAWQSPIVAPNRGQNGTNFPGGGQGPGGRPGIKGNFGPGPVR